MIYKIMGGGVAKPPCSYGPVTCFKENIFFSLAISWRKCEVLPWRKCCHLCLGALQKLLTFCNVSVITQDICSDLLTIKTGIHTTRTDSSPFFFLTQFMTLFQFSLKISLLPSTGWSKISDTISFLAHLSTMCSGWAIVIDHCPASVRPSVRPCVRPSGCEQLLKKSSPLKPANRFQWNFTEMILGWCTFRKLQRYEFREELWLPWQPKEKTSKIFSSQTVRARAFIFGM